MAISFKRKTIIIPQTTGKEYTSNDSIEFPGIIKTADVSLSGFFIAYDSGNHQIKQIKIVILPTSLSGSSINFKIDALMRDDSGNIDDPYSGWIEVLAIADLTIEG